MNERAEKIGSALAQLCKALPGCNAVHYRAFSDWAELTVDVTTDLAVGQIAESLGLPPPEPTVIPGVWWLAAGSKPSSGLTVVVSGPHHQGDYPVLVGADLDAALAAVTEAA